MRAPPQILIPPVFRRTRSNAPASCARFRYCSASASTLADVQKPSVPKKPATSKAPATGRAAVASPAPRQEKAGAEFGAEPELSSDTLRPILTGDEWQDTRLRFEQWLSAQTLYDADQVKQMRGKFAERVKTTTQAGRNQFIKDTDAKLQILYGPGTIDLQHRFAESMAAATPAYVKKSRQQLPDVVASTPDQLKDRLAGFALRYKANVEAHQTFDQLRQHHIATNEMKGARRAEQLRAPPSHIASSSGGGNRQGKGGYTKARDYYPQSNSSISYSIIPAMPMMTTGGFAMFGGGVAITIQRNR